MDGNRDGDGDGVGSSSLNARVGRLETDMATLKADVKWIKVLVAPTFLVTFVSLLIMIVKFGVV